MLTNLHSYNLSPLLQSHILCILLDYFLDRDILHLLCIVWFELHRHPAAYTAFSPRLLFQYQSRVLFSSHILARKPDIFMLIDMISSMRCYN